MFCRYKIQDSNTLPLNYCDENSVPDLYDLTPFSLNAAMVFTMTERGRLWHIRKVYLFGREKELQETNIHMLLISQEIAERSGTTRTITNGERSIWPNRRIYFEFSSGRWLVV
jgi:hypothetical protein